MLINILAVLNIVAFVIMFVGYWTYADYYTNISEFTKSLYWFLHAYMYPMAITAYGVEFFNNKDWNHAYVLSTGVLIIGSLLIVTVLTLKFIICSFIKSRKHFGEKRNKI